MAIQSASGLTPTQSTAKHARCRPTNGAMPHQSLLSSPRAMAWPRSNHLMIVSTGVLRSIA